MARGKPAANGWSSGASVRRCEVKVLCKDPRLAPLDGASREIRLVDLVLEDEEYLGPGPTSRRVAVVDYNAELDVVFAPASVRADGKGFAVGKLGARFRENIAFRQVNVWALIQRTLNLLEDGRLFGRPIRWASGRGRLIVLPHAGYGENAYYDRATGALHFLYFEGAKGEPVYTCLSHDIVLHELGHAVLDGLKPGYNEVTSAETAAFHEFFGDALAITSSLTFRELLAQVVGKSKATELDDVLGEIAAELGAANGGEPFLRTAARLRSLEGLGGSQQEHALSEVLTNAFYEYLRRRYKGKLREVCERGGKVVPDGGDAVRALILAASETSRLFFRAIDYCSPVDITFAQYARAIVTADQVAYPTNPSARDLALEILAERGIVPAPAHRLSNRDLSEEYDVDRIAATAADAARFIDANRAALSLPMEANLRVTGAYRTKKSTSEGYVPPQEIVIELEWSADVELRGQAFRGLDGTRATLPCGATLVFDQNGNVLSYVVAGDTPERRGALSRYIEYLARRGRIGAPGRAMNDEPDAFAISAEIVNGSVRFERIAALRHEHGRHERSVG